jgi:hypothetical protein
MTLLSQKPFPPLGVIAKLSKIMYNTGKIRKLLGVLS